MQQYYILTSNPNFASVLDWLSLHDITAEIHINRTRFYIPTDNKLHTEFCLRWSHCCSPVDPTLDLTTGLPIEDC